VRGHKGKVTKRWEFERVNPDVERKNHFQEGESTRVLLDKKYFDVYQSVAKGSEHHMRFKAPKALWGFIACVVIFVVGGYDFYKRRIADPIEAAQPAAEGQADLQGSVNEPVNGGFLATTRARANRSRRRNTSPCALPELPTCQALRRSTMNSCSR